MRRTARNSLIWSALIGLLLMVSSMEVPEFIFYTLKELGNTSGPVAIFLLGASFYGRGNPYLAWLPCWGKSPCSLSLP
ncbi:MAG: hypothetical protein J7J65_07350 [Candidatus Korarchaeota archaeon]|nr:hypothetical protein [Candidatus Korarchaeota archaeon]